MEDDVDMMGIPIIVARIDRFHEAARRLNRIPDLISIQDIINFYKKTSTQGWFETVVENSEKEFQKKKGIMIE
jgi:hypothetical protein